MSCAMTNTYRERALFVIGRRNAGKSAQLRNLFADCRIGDGNPNLTPGRIVQDHYLSNERGLHIRLQSPHEKPGTYTDFLTYLDNHLFGPRCSFAGALWPNRQIHIPDAVTFIGNLQNDRPFERIRLVLLSPDRNEGLLDGVDFSNTYQTINHVIDALYDIPRVEVVFLDARDIMPGRRNLERRRRNGLFLADFFAFI